MGLVDRVHNSGFIVTNQGDEIKRFQVKRDDQPTRGWATPELSDNPKTKRATLGA